MRYILLLCFALAGCASPDGGRDVAGLRNSRWVDKSKSIGVSAQPKLYEFLNLPYSISNIICFNHRSEKLPSRMVATVHCHYISTWRQIFGGPKLKAIFEQAMSEVTPGTLIHCTHGANRSGDMYIRLLMAQGTSKADAIVMANKYGWKTSFHGLVKDIKDL